MSYEIMTLIMDESPLELCAAKTRDAGTV
jgi:hypothetical protein